MESDALKYEYAPLKGPHEIRLIEFPHDAYDEKTMIFNCNLRVINLKDYKNPPYYALSYTWKSPNIEEMQAPARPSPLHIRCNGRIINIGENLYDCLYQIDQLPNDEEEEPGMTFVWIDAICINQDDLAERGSQVAMMQEIYSKAEGTLIWLGRQDKASLQALPLIKQLSDAADPHLPTESEVSYDAMMSNGQLHDEQFFTSAGITPLTSLEWHSISSFFLRSWFHRLWTVQELIMGKRYNKVLMCGDTLLRMEEVEDFIALAMVRGWRNTLRALEFGRSKNLNNGTVLGIEISLSMGAMYKSSPDSNGSELLKFLFDYHDGESFDVAKFAWMLQNCRQKQATDERDRVYAPSGMISEFRKTDSWHLLEPDYSRSTEEVFTNASTFILLSLRNLSWLSYVQDRSLKIHKNLPSWVPDLATFGQPTSLILAGNHNVFRKRAELVGKWQPAEPLVLTHDDASLSVRGCLLDKIVGTTYDMNETLLNHKISKLIVAAARFSIYEPGDTWLDALMKTLAVDTAVAPDWGTNSIVSPLSRDFSNLLAPFIYFLKLEIVLEMWSWNLSQTKGASGWWEMHADFARLCDLDDLLPPRDEFEELLSTFTSYYPCHPNTKLNGLEDKSYQKIFYKLAEPYVQRCTLSCTYRAFVQTRDSRMGLAPLSARSEDEIWIIEGAKFPFILRRRLDGSFEFMGEAYIHGIMQGELFEQENGLNFHEIRLK